MVVEDIVVDEASFGEFRRIENVYFGEEGVVGDYLYSGNGSEWVVDDVVALQTDIVGDITIDLERSCPLSADYQSVLIVSQLEVVKGVQLEYAGEGKSSSIEFVEGAVGDYVSEGLGGCL